MGSHERHSVFRTKMAALPREAFGPLNATEARLARRQCCSPWAGRARRHWIATWRA